MKHIRLACSCLVLLTSLTPLAVSAQQIDNAQLFERLDKIERDNMLLQRQLARGGTPVASGADANTPAGGSAQLEVRLSAIEDQLRELRGKLEESENRSRKALEQVEKIQRDVEFRLNEMSSAQPMAAAAPQPTGGATGSGSNSPTPLLGQTQPQPQPAESDKPVQRQDLTSFATPRELYNYAFRLLNQTQYEEAATAFAAFTKKYPKDPLVGNAFYWGGETYYIRRDYVNAADHFRQGFEALPEGPKAPDNLLKLAMSLNAVSRDKEACLVLQQVITKYKKNASSVAERAETEQKRIGCKKS